MSIRRCSRCLVFFFAFEVIVSSLPLGHATDWPQAGFDAARTGFNPDEIIIGPSNVGNLQLLWTNHVPCTIRDGLSVVDGVVYYGHYCEEFRAVDAETGRLIWNRRLDGKDVGQAVENGVAYVASIGAMYAFDAASLDAADLRAPGFYRFLYIRDEKHKRQRGPVSAACDCPCCQHYSLSYLHHLFDIGDRLGLRLATLHNLRFYTQLLERITEMADVAAK